MSKIEHVMLSVSLAGMMLILFPSHAVAQTENKTSLVFEINNIQTVKIPGIYEIDLLINSKETSKPVEQKATDSTPAVAAKAVTKPAQAPANPSKNILPPKVTGTDRVYMHEPEIRAYVCPKLGDKCNIFIGILKAENGSHECTRDNRGLNRNGSVDIGLTQINWTPNSPYTVEQLRDCKFNLDIALKKYETRGFQPWAAYNSGRYLKHMPAVLASAKALEAAKAAEVAVLN